MISLTHLSANNYVIMSLFMSRQLRPKILSLPELHHRLHYTCILLVYGTQMDNDPAETSLWIILEADLLFLHGSCSSDEQYTNVFIQCRYSGESWNYTVYVYVYICKCLCNATLEITTLRMWCWGIDVTAQQARQQSA